MNDLDRPTTLQLALRMTSDAVEAYSANPALRAAVVIAVPFVGGAFDAIVGTAGSNVALERLETFLHELGDRIAALEEAKRDPDVIERVIVDATIRAVRGSMETGDQTKVRTLASMLVGATSRDRPAELDAESAVASLASLTPSDLEYARQLVDAVKDNRFAHIDLGRVEAPGPDAQFRLMRLLGAGLLEAEGSGGIGAGPRLHYRFTPTMWRILELLKAGGEDVNIPN